MILGKQKNQKVHKYKENNILKTVIIFMQIFSTIYPHTHAHMTLVTVKLSFEFLPYLIFYFHGSSYNCDIVQRLGN